jgi:hypothetical protein
MGGRLMHKDQEKPFIKSPFIHETLKVIDNLRRKERDFGIPSCMLLTGESGSGKSELAKYYLKSNPIIEKPERTRIQVLHFELKSVSTPRDLLISLLVAIGDPQLGRNARNQDDLFERLIGLIKVVGLELLILDEIQVIIERRSQQVLTGIADLFKDLIKNAKIPIIFIGMPWSKYLFSSNRQLARRVKYRYQFPVFRVSNKTERDDYRIFLKLLANSYGLLLQLQDLELTYRVFAATDGVLSSTVDLVSDACILSKMDNEPMDVSLLAKTMRSYGVPDLENPFLMNLENLSIRELIEHSDWEFNARANKNAHIEGKYATYGISTNGKLFSKTA